MAFNFDNEINRLSRFPQEAKGWLREIFLKDWGLKLLALAVTLILWFGVTGQRTPERKSLIGVRLSFTLPPNMDIGNNYRNEVNVTVSGDKSEIIRLDGRPLVATVDVSSFPAGEQLVQLTTKNVSLDLPTGVKIEAITPNSVLIHLEPHIEKELDVAPRFSGKPADGYEIIGTPEITPAKVKISGPESHVKAIDKAPTAKISLDGLKSDYTVVQVAIDIKDDKVSIVDSGVTVKIKIGEQRIEKTFDNVSVRVSTGERANVETANVTLYGAKSSLENLRLEDISILLEAGQDGSITPRLVLPQALQGKIELRSTKPSVFSIVK